MAARAKPTTPELTGPGRIRALAVAVLVAGALLSAPTASDAAAPPVSAPAPAPSLATASAAVSGRGITLSGGPTLKVNVNPNLRGTRYWEFRLKKRSGGRWRTVGTYRTQGRSEIRRLAVGAGRYRVRVLAGHGRAGRTSPTFTFAPVTTPTPTPTPSPTPTPVATPTPTPTPTPIPDPVARVDLGASMAPNPAPTISDYVVDCPGGTVTAEVTATEGAGVVIEGLTPISTSTRLSVPLDPGQSLSWVLQVPGHDPVTQHVRCLPTDFPEWTVSRTGQPRSQWYLFSPSLVSAASTHYSIVTDNRGTPVWWMPTGSNVPIDLSLLPDGSLTWAYAFGGYSLAATYKTYSWDGTPGPVLGTGLALDQHDLQALPNGNFLAIRYRLRDCASEPADCTDMSTWGGSDQADLIDGEIVEFDKDNHIVWQWSTRGHVDLAESAAHLTTNAHVGVIGGHDYWDVVHLNSVQPDGDDAVIISARHTDAVYRVIKSTGQIDWKLGGTPTAQSLDVLGDRTDPFLHSQHDARLNADGTLSIFDNGDGVDRTPRVVRVAVDADARTATLVSAITDPSVPGSFCCGSARTVDSGGFVIGWGGPKAGTLGTITEVDAAGDPVLRISMLDGFTYRAFPVAQGVVDPATIRAGMDAMHPRTG